MLPMTTAVCCLRVVSLLFTITSALATPVGGDGKTAEAAAVHWSSFGWLEMAGGDNACDVKASGAVGDNSTDDTLAIQRAIDSCRKAHPVAAVVVLSGPAVYRVTASVELGSNLTLLIDKETTLLSVKAPPAPCNETVARQSGTTCVSVPPYTPMPVAQNPRCPTLYWPKLDTSVLCGSNLTNVAILGADQNTSVFDGGGIPWYWRWKLGLDGPRLFEVAWSSNITLAHATFQNSGGWTVHPTFCDGVLAHHIRILNPRWVGNTDGFDPDSCTNVRLHDSIIDTGDDGISIKSGNTSVEEMAARAGRNIPHTKQTIQRPSKDIHIYRTKVLSRNFCLGSATYGGIMNLLMEDCELGDDKGSMPWAIKYKSHQSYAGALVNHTYRRLKVGKMAPTWQQPRAGFFISIELRYHPLIPNRSCHVNLETLEGDCPIFKDITFEDIAVAGAMRAGDINGFKGDLLKGLSFKNVTFAKKPVGGWSCGYTDLASFSAVDVAPPLSCRSGEA